MNIDVIRQQIDRLLLIYPELSEDETLRADMVEGATDAHEFLRIIERKRQEACSLAGAIATNIAELSDRQSRFERRETAMRELAFKIMQQADLRKIELPEATLSIAKGKQKLLGEAEPETLPDNLVRIKREPNRAAIRSQLETGGTVPGFQLSNAEPHLTIRTK